MNALMQFSHELERLVERASQGVVGVEHDRGQASGFILTDDGCVVTNSHVVREARSGLRLRLANGERVRAWIIGDDPETDLAVLRSEARGFAPLTVGDKSRLMVGRLVVALGDPLRFERSVSLGVISAVDRALATGRGRLVEGLVQTDAAINPGNSGGPLVDAEAVVVGVNTAMVPFAQGIGFAIPAPTISWVASVLLRRGRIDRPRLGVAARSETLGAELAARQGRTRALRVVGVKSGSAAASAGLAAGDWVLAANGSPVETADDLQRVLVLAQDSGVALSVLRADEPRSLVAHPRVAA